ncbi:MAG: hypothetical protein KIH01_06930 [Candidatus Freyarchaeota archaeon]|nr:hypothetical protein [Candidatus Jordarchaeia archaeon]
MSGSMKNAVPYFKALAHPTRVEILREVFDKKVVNPNWMKKKTGKSSKYVYDQLRFLSKSSLGNVLKAVHLGVIFLLNKRLRVKLTDIDDGTVKTLDEMSTEEAAKLGFALSHEKRAEIYDMLFEAHKRGEHLSFTTMARSLGLERWRVVQLCQQLADAGIVEIVGGEEARLKKIVELEAEDLELHPSEVLLTMLEIGF